MLSPEEKEKFAKLVADMRGDRPLRTLAKELNVSFTTIRAWEQCESEPQLQHLITIAEKKGWSLPYIYYYLKGERPSFFEVKDLTKLLTERERKELVKALAS